MRDSIIANLRQAIAAVEDLPEDIGRTSCHVHHNNIHIYLEKDDYDEKFRDFVSKLEGEGRSYQTASIEFGGIRYETMFKKTTEPPTTYRPPAKYSNVAKAAGEVS